MGSTDKGDLMTRALHAGPVDASLYELIVLDWIDAAAQDSAQFQLRHSAAYLMLGRYSFDAARLHRTLLPDLDALGVTGQAVECAPHLLDASILTSAEEQEIFACAAGALPRASIPGITSIVPPRWATGWPTPGLGRAFSARHEAWLRIAKTYLPQLQALPHDSAVGALRTFSWAASRETASLHPLLERAAADSAAFAAVEPNLVDVKPLRDAFPELMRELRGLQKRARQDMGLA